MIEVRASYPFDGSFHFDEACSHAAGRPADYSGCGFGDRDLGWTCKSEFEAERIKRALIKIGMSPRIDRPEENEETNDIVSDNGQFGVGS